MEIIQISGNTGKVGHSLTSVEIEKMLGDLALS